MIIPFDRAGTNHNSKHLALAYSCRYALYQDFPGGSCVRDVVERKAIACRRLSVEGN